MKILSMIGLAAFFILEAPAAYAYFEICNSLDEDESFAIGYKENGRWIASGWWLIKSGDCKIVYGENISGRYIYFVPESYNPDLRTENSSTFCVDKSNNFEIYDRDPCVGPNRERRDMLETYTEPRYHSQRVWSTNIE